MTTNGKLTESLNIGNLFSVETKTIFVTGGSRGIGFMIAHAFVTNGATVYMTARKSEACQQSAAELSQIGKCEAIPGDLSTDEGRAAVISALRNKCDSLDVLVNNAGASWGANFEEYPESGYDKVMDINVRAPFMLTRDLLPMLEKSGSVEDPSRVINIGSIDGLRVSSVPNFAYGPSKAAIHHLTRILAVELGRKYVTVNAIAPGLFESKMTAWLLEEHGDRIRKQCPLGRIGYPQDMAGLALFLASKAGAYVNGAVIPIDGGTHISS